MSLPIVDHHDLTNKANNTNSSSQTTFSFNSSKLKLVNKSKKLKTQVDQFLKDTQPTNEDENNEHLTKNQLKKLKKQSKKVAKVRLFKFF